MRSHNAMHLSKCGVSFARCYSVEFLRSFQKINIPCKGAASRLRAYVYNAAFLQRGICILFRTYSSIIMRSIPLVQCTCTHIRQRKRKREIYIYIYTCSVIIYNFDLPGAALQARQSSVQILSVNSLKVLDLEAFFQMCYIPWRGGANHQGKQHS